MTAYVDWCVARALAEFPDLNAYRRRRSLVVLDDVIIEVLLERRIAGQAAVGSAGVWAWSMDSPSSRRSRTSHLRSTMT